MICASDSWEAGHRRLTEVLLSPQELLHRLNGQGLKDIELQAASIQVISLGDPEEPLPKPSIDRNQDFLPTLQEPPYASI